MLCLKLLGAAMNNIHQPAFHQQVHKNLDDLVQVATKKGQVS